MVSSNRPYAFALDTTMQYWVDKRVEIFPEDSYNYEVYETLIKHLTSMTKITDEDEDGRQYATWKGSKASDFAHAWNYLCMAIEAEATIVNRVLEPRIEGLKMQK